jgi:hypothetical protein
LIGNGDMSKKALQAKKKLKDNSLPPAQSTRCNYRKLRSSTNSTLSINKSNATTTTIFNI